MTSRIAPLFAALALAAIAFPAAAQDGWTGFYTGVYAGVASDPDDDSDRILFDTNLDGQFGDTVRTGAGADAFSPGFCNGVARDRTPASGCEGNTGGADWGLRAGYDWQFDGFVVGAVFDLGNAEVRDAVAAFSTTPARYTMLRKVDTLAALRARAGFVFGEDDRNLVYATAGFARGRIANSFDTSNTANSFTPNGDGDADGTQYGVGYEFRISEAFTIGAEYLMTSLDDDEARVRVGPGSAPPTNPFLLQNPAGTDFRRSDDELEFDSFRVLATYRFE